MKMAETSLCVDTQFLKFVHQIEQDIGHVAGKITVFAEHKRSSIIFRAHPYYRGRSLWRDWVMIQWETGVIPCPNLGIPRLDSLAGTREFPLDDGTIVGKGFGPLSRVLRTRKYHPTCDRRSSSVILFLTQPKTMKTEASSSACSTWWTSNLSSSPCCHSQCWHQKGLHHDESKRQLAK